MIIYHQKNVGAFAGNEIWYWQTQPLLNQQISVTSAVVSVTVTGKDVVVSFMKWVESELAGTYAVDWPDVDFDSSQYDEWIKPRVIGFVPDPSRKDEKLERWGFQISCYARTGKDGGKSIWRTLEIAGDVGDAFSQFDLPVRNWNISGDPISAYLRFDPMQTDWQRQGLKVADLSETRTQLSGYLTET